MAQVFGDVTGTGVTFNGAVTANGSGGSANQTFNAGTGTLWAKSTINKSTAGNLTLAGDTLVDLDGTVSASNGSVTVDNVAQVFGDVTGTGVTFNGAVTANGSGGSANQTFNAGTGTLWAKTTINKSTAGNLTLAGDTLVDLDGTVSASNGSVTVDNVAQVFGDVTGTGVTFNGAVTANGSGGSANQTFNAGTGTLWAKSTINKSTAGNLTLAGDTLVDLDGTVSASNGSVTVDNVAQVFGDVTGTGVTFNGAVTANGSGGSANQTFNAGTGTLWAKSTINKSTAGNLTLAGDTLVDLDGTVDVDAGSLYIEDNFSAAGDLLASDDVTLSSPTVDATLDGVVDQRIDAEGGTLWADGTITKTGEGDLYLAGQTAIDLDGTVDVDAGSLYIEDNFSAAGDLLASDDVTLSSPTVDATLDGVVDQRIDAEGGTLWADGTITKTGEGDLYLAGQTAIDLDGTVDVDAGSLYIEDNFSAAGDLLASDDVTLSSPTVDATLDGVVDQRIDAEGGTLWADGTITKTGEGDLYLAGQTAIDLDGTVDVDAGSLYIEDNFSAAGDLLASDDVTLSSPTVDATLDGVVDQRIDAEGGTLWADGTITKTGEGDLYLAGQTAIDLDGTVDVDAGSLYIEDNFSAAGDLLASDDVTLSSPTVDATLDGVVDQRIDAEGGTLWADGTITKTGEGDLYLAGQTAIDLDGTVDVDAGSLYIEDNFSAAGDLLASDDVTLSSPTVDATLDGVVDQRIDAEGGTLWADGTITKTGEGDLYLAGQTAIDLDGTVDVQGGALEIEDAFSASGAAIQASADVTLDGAATLDGAIGQEIDAINNTLWAKDTITKNTAGKLTLSAGTLVDLDGIDGITGDSVNVTGGALTINGQTDAEGNLRAKGLITLNGTANLAGNVISTGSGITFADNVTADGADGQKFNAGSGTLLAQGTITKNTAGKLTLSAGTLVDLDGIDGITGDSVNVTGGALTINGQTDAEGNLRAKGLITLNGTANLAGNVISTGSGITFADNVTADGADGQKFNAGSGTLLAQGTITKNTAGKLTLSAGTLVDLDGIDGITGDSVNVTGGALTINGQTDAEGNLRAKGLITLNGTANLAGNVISTGSGITFADNVTADGADGQKFNAGSGTLLAQGTITKNTAGKLTLSAGTLVDLDGIDGITGDSVNVTGGALTINGQTDAEGNLRAKGLITLNGTANLAGNVISTGSGITFADNVTADGADGQKFNAGSGTLLAQGTITKNTAGKLTLSAGTLVDLDGIDGITGDSVNVTGGALTINGQTDAEGNLRAKGLITLNGTANLAGNVISTGSGITFADNVTADGADGQKFNAGSGTLLAQGTITKNTAGKLTLSAGTLVDLDGIDGITGDSVNVTGGALTINGQTDAEGNLRAKGLITLNGTANLAGNVISTGSGITFADNVTADGAVDQRIDAEDGTLWANGTLTKTGTGDLYLAGDTAIDLDGTVDVQAGSLEIEDAFSASGAAIQASADVTLDGAATLDGAIGQEIDAINNTLWAKDTITKTGAGKLNLGGATGINLDGTVDVQAGSLEIEDAFSASGAAIQASADVTLDGAATLDGAIGQEIDAINNTLWAKDTITKTGAGKLNLGGATGINLDGTVDVQAGSLEIEDAFSASGAAIQASADVTLDGAATLDGAIGQEIDAINNTLWAKDTITKTGAGKLNLGGATGINLDGTVDVQAGSLEIEDAFSASGAAIQASADVTLDGAATLDGAIGQEIDAINNTLWAKDTITKTGAGKLNLGGATGINLDGTVDVQAGSLEIEDAFSASGAAIQASADVTLDGAATLDGAIGQEIDAINNTLWAKDTITKTGAGKLNLGGATGINLDGTVDVQAGSLEIEDAFSASGAAIQASADVTLDGAATLDGAIGQEIDAINNTLWAKDTITKTGAGKLNLGGATGINLDGTVDVQAGSLEIEDAFSASGAAIQASADVTLDGAATLDGAIGQEIDAINNTLWAKDTITKTGAGKLNLGGATGINLDGTVDVQAGSLEIEDAFSASGAAIQASADVTLDGAATLDGAIGQEIDAINNTLWAKDTITKTGAGKLNLGGATGINLDGTVDVQAGSLEIEDAFSASGAAIQASADVTLDGAATLDGAIGQEIDAINNTLWAKDTITKTGAGKLNLGGATGINLDGTVDVQAGSLEIEDAFSASGAAIQASADVTLDGAATLDGAIGQEIDAINNTLWAKDTITKTGAGKLNLGGATGINLDGTVDVQAGSLEIEDAFSASGAAIQASADVTLDGAATLDGAIGQEIDAINNTLWAKDTITKTGAGKLNLGGATGINLDGTVDVQAGSLEIEDAFSASGAAIQASADVTLDGAATLDGAIGQEIDAINNTLWAKDTITKTGAGKLNLGGATGINLDGTVDVQAGSLEIEDAFSASGAAIQASADVTLDGAATLDGAIGQEIDAINNTLWAKDTITKTGAGKLNLGGATGINLDGTVDVQAGSLEIEDAFSASGAAIQASADVTLDGAATLDGAIGQEIDAINNTLWAKDTITKTGAGKLNLGGATGINLDGTVDVQAGSLEIEDAFSASGAAIQASADVTLDGAATLDGAIGQEIDAINNTLWAKDTITKTGAGKLNLGGATGINLDGTVDVQAGSLEIEDAFSASGAAIQASADVTLDGAATLDGAIGQEIDAINNTLWAKDTITKTGAGKLNLGGATGINLDGTVDVQAGSLEIEDAFSASGAAIQASADVTLDGAATLDGAIGQEIDAINNTLWAKDTITKTGAGKLNLGGATGINLDGTVDVKAGSLYVEDNAIVAPGISLRASTNITSSAGKVLTGEGDLTLEATGGGISEKAGDDGKVGINMAADNATLTLTQNNALDIDRFDVINDEDTDLVATSTGGSVTSTAADSWKSMAAAANSGISLQGAGNITTNALQSTTSNISVKSSAGNLIVNGAVNALGGGVSLVANSGKIYTAGGSDDTLNVAISGFSDDSTGTGVDLPYGLGKAAIVIMSREDLKLGPGAKLVAGGVYDITGTVDDRSGVGFLDVPATIGGASRNPGDPFDAAIYLASTAGNVDVASQVTIVPSGTMVIDAYDTVTFGAPGSLFEASLLGGNVGNRLEVCSRISEWLSEAVGRLPYVDGSGPFPPTYAYVLRGAGLLGNPGITDGRAWVLENPLPPTPLGPLQIPGAGGGTEFAQGGGWAALRAWLANELGVSEEDIQVFLADTFALSTDVQLYDVLARLRAAAAILEDPQGTGVAALAQVINEFITTPAPPSEEQMTQIAEMLASHTGDGTYYATAEEHIDALVEYVNFLVSDMGWSPAESITFVMNKYGAPITESGNAALVAYVGARLAAIGG